MKFLWESNAPWAGTGYGQQTKLMLSALQGLGHEPSCFCFYGLNGGSIVYDGYQCLPNSDYETWGNDVIKIHARRSEAELIVTLMDLFVLNADVWGKLDVPWVAWTPLDAEGIGPATLRMLKLVDHPVAMSQFGAKQMTEVGVEPAAVIWHAVDTDTYKPLDREESREILGLPQDAFVIGMVMANKGDRKQYPLHFKAVKEFKANHPEAVIFLHTEPTSVMGGWDMRGLTDTLDLSGSVYSTNQYDAAVVPMAQSTMAMIYNAFDVLMNCSAGEGFGIPIVEAQACGIPVITGGYTAMPEITINGYTVEAITQHLGGHFGWQFTPSVEDMIYKLECIYRRDKHPHSELGRQWVIDNCSVPVISSQWDDVLKGALEIGKRELGTVAKLPDEYVVA